MRVLIVSTEAPDNILGGLGRYVSELAFSLERKGVDVDILFLDEENDKSTYRRIDYSPDFDHEDGLVGRMSTALKVRTQVNPRDYDVIHCNEYWTTVPFWHDDNVLFFQHASRPGLLNSGACYFPSELFLQQIAIDRCAKLVTNSKWSAIHLGYQFGRRAEIVPLGVNLEKFNGRRIFKEKPVVSFFGRHYDESKGFEKFEELAKRFQGKADFRVYSPVKIDGRGHYKHFINLPDNEIEHAYLESDVVVMPSKHESFGLVGLEAIASNCILLCTPGLGMDEYCNEINSVRTDDLSAGLDSILTNLGIHRKNARDMKIRETVMDYSWDDCADDHIEIYREIMNG